MGRVEKMSHQLNEELEKMSNKKDDSYLLWDCFVNWALTLEKIGKDT